MQRFFIPFILLCSFSFSHAQKIITGKILNSTDQQPIAYANIGIKNSNAGTISNEDGSFSLPVPSRTINDTLFVSSLGFSNKAIAIKFFKESKAYTIFLHEKIISLKQVTVKSKKEKLKRFELGNRSFKGGVYEPDTLYAGRAMALLIDDKDPAFGKGLQFPAYIEKARLRIFRNNLSSFKFRVRINAVDARTGAPAGDLLEQSVVLESGMRNGWLEFDLSGINYQVEGPFFISFEQIMEKKDRAIVADGFREFIRKHPNRLKTDTVEIDGKKEVEQKLGWGAIDLPGTFIGIVSSDAARKKYTCYTRETSFGEWKSARGILTATVELSNQPDASPAEPVVSCNTGIAECTAEKYCRNFMDETGMNGMQVQVSIGNKIRWGASLGYADIENKIVVTDSTRFRINSISKSMTSLALIRLMAAKQLDLDAPVQKYLPGFPEKKYPITIRQLAGHLAGFRDYKEDDPADYIRTEHFATATAALRVFQDDTLLFEPGTRFYYSPFGFNLIGSVIENISGTHYLDYMRKNIWVPMQLFNTCGDEINGRIPGRSKFYGATGEEEELGDLSYKYPAGGLLSTATDLVKMGNELLHGTVTDPGLRHLLFETQYTTDKQPTGYGLGWYTGTDRNGHRIWYHSGDSFSSSSGLIIYPDDDMVISFLGNSQDGVAFDLQELGAMFYKK